MNSGFEICKFQAKAHMSTCAVFALRSSIVTCEALYIIVACEALYIIITCETLLHSYNM